MRAPPPNAPSTPAPSCINMYSTLPTSRSIWRCGAPAPPLRPQRKDRTIIPPPNSNQTHKTPTMPIHALRLTVFLLLASLCSPRPSPAQNLNVTPAAQSILNQIYSGDLTAAIDSAHKLQQDRPDHPIGYLLEEETLSWEIWSTSAEFKYHMSYARQRAKLPSDDHYLDLASKIIQLSANHIAASGDTPATAYMHFYAGVG